MKKYSAFLLLLFVSIAPASYATDKNGPDPEPIAWGMLTQNRSCVIFAEGRKNSGMYWGVAVTVKSQGKLTVLEQQNYAMEEKEFIETQETMDNLMRRAQKDMIKFVKIPVKHSPQLLDKARELCK